MRFGDSPIFGNIHIFERPRFVVLSGDFLQRWTDFYVVVEKSIWIFFEWNLMISPCGEHLNLWNYHLDTYTYVWGFAFQQFEMALSSAKCFIPSKRAFSCLFWDLIKHTKDSGSAFWQTRHVQSGTPHPQEMPVWKAVQPLARPIRSFMTLYSISCQFLECSWLVSFPKPDQYVIWNCVLVMLTPHVIEIQRWNEKQHGIDPEFQWDNFRYTREN